MNKYTDDEIRNMKKITCQIAADYLGISVIAVRTGMRYEKLPIGFAIKNEDSYTDIIPERLIAYKYGKINEVQVRGIEQNLENIIKEFTEMKSDLSFLLRGDE